MLVAVVFLSVCGVGMTAPQNLQVNPPETPNLDLLLSQNAFHSMANVKKVGAKNEKNNIKERTMESMLTALDVQSMIKTFDPKFVVVNEQQGEMPEGIHDALVKSLISDLHAADVPVVYAQKHNIAIS